MVSLTRLRPLLVGDSLQWGAKIERPGSPEDGREIIIYLPLSRVPDFLRGTLAAIAPKAGEMLGDATDPPDAMTPLDIAELLVGKAQRGGGGD